MKTKMRNVHRVEKQKMTPKMILFCKAYVCNGWNATKAAMEAGYNHNIAAVIGHRLLIKDNIQQRIKHVREHTEETIGLNKEMIMREHMKLAFSSIAHLHNTWIERKEFESLTDQQKECIAEIDTKTVHKVATEYSDSGEFVKVPYDVEYIRIKLYDKQKSLDSLSKLMGYDAPAKLDIEVQNKRKETADIFPSLDQIQKRLDAVREMGQ